MCNPGDYRAFPPEMLHPRKTPGRTLEITTQTMWSCGPYMKTLLSTDEHPYLPGWRETITSELFKYIKATGRLMINQPASEQPRSDIHN
ncbi:hypothetical protein DPMN_156644 [Dreissena polymorpha]|uniref:Uncharacterized protein n=1 Tax=Dreissena polymorpha TaxID=45954 RepID=A0A9D4FTX3_DREPO|nr:hypothetical protein DPMN_156644 [Dreissena polymorpha]